jgi:hypothetical protein
MVIHLYLETQLSTRWILCHSYLDRFFDVFTPIADGEAGVGGKSWERPAVELGGPIRISIM